MRHWWMLCLLLLAACGGGDPNAGGNNPGEPPRIIQWNRDPLAVVFRADVVGGERSPVQAANYIPPCTIYGDGRIVFTRPNPNGNTDVIFDVLNDSRIDDFVNYLTVDQRIFTYDEGFIREVPQSVTPVYEQIVLEVNGTRHVTDAFANWPGSYFAEIVEACQRLAPTPRLFVPTGAWVGAVPIANPDPLKPTILWNNEAAGINLSGIAQDGTVRWVESNAILSLWNNVILSPGDVQFNDQIGIYAVTLQVPGVTLNAPAAPQQ